MTEWHLADQQIQAYLDNPGSLSRFAQNHLMNCAVCQQSVEKYRTLCAAVETADLPVLSPGFADRVMLRLPIEHQTAPVGLMSRQIVGWVAVGGAIVTLAAIGVVSYLLPGLFTQLAAFWVSTYQSVSSSLRDTMLPMFTDLHLRPSIILSSIVTFLGAAAIDRIVIRYRHRRLTPH